MNAENLDELLGAWSASVRLSDADAEAVRQTVLADQAGLDADWWRGFTTQIGGVMANAGRAGWSAWAGAVTVT